MDKNIYILCKESMRQLEMMKHIDLKVVVKRNIKSMLGQNVLPKDLMFWPAGALLLGLAEAVISNETDEEDSYKTEVLDYIYKYVSDWLNSKESKAIKNTDDSLAGYALIRMYEYTKDNLFKSAAEKIADFIISAPADDSGSIIYHPERGNKYIFADGAGMMAAFMAEYGRVFQKEEFINKAYIQVNNFMNFGMDKASFLPYHGFDYDAKEKKGLVGWGRAIGWLMLGMSQVLVNKSDDIYISKYTELIKNVCSFQRYDGSFSWLPPAIDAHEDTSATAMIGYGMGIICESNVVSDDFKDELKQSIKKISLYLSGQIADGKVDNSLGECVDFAMHPQKYGVYPWGEGMTLAFLSRVKELIV